MKRNQIAFILLLTLIFTNCTKKNDTNPPVTVTSFKFNANGTNYSIDGSLAVNSNTGSIIKKVLPNGTQVQGFEISALTNSDYVLSLFIPTTANLTATTYSINRTNYTSGERTVFWAPARVQYAHARSGDFMTITITKIENGLASGTFTARYSGPTATQIVNITDGSFQNVQILN